MNKAPIQWISLIALLTFAGLFVWEAWSSGTDWYKAIMLCTIAVFWLVQFVRKTKSGSQEPGEE